MPNTTQIRLNRESDAALLSILTAKQKGRLTQIKSQIFGTTSAFQGKIASELALTDHQQSKLLKYLVKLKNDNIAQFDQWKKHPEGAFLSKQFINTHLFENYFDETQRQKWKNHLGEKVPEDVLKKLSILQFERTRLHC